MDGAVDPVTTGEDAGASELAILARAPRQVDLGEAGVVEIRPMVARQWLRIAEPGAQVMAAVREAVPERDDGLQMDEILKRVDILYLLRHSGDALLESLAIASGREVAFVEQLDPAQLLDLVDAVVEVNWRFFVERLLPMVEALGGKWQAKARAAGQTPSSA